jgi:hypothetical protein
MLSGMVALPKCKRLHYTAASIRLRNMPYTAPIAEDGIPQMNNNQRTARRCAAGVGMAAGAVAAAAALMVSASIARADTIDELLTQSEGDMIQAADLFPGVDTSSLPAIGGVVSGLQNQGDLISQIQSIQDGLPEAIQTSAPVLDADQQLATASGDLLSSSNLFVNAIDAGDFPLFHASSLAGDLMGLEATFSFLDAELFQVIPAELDALLAPLGAEFAGAFDSDIGSTSASAAAASADAVTATDAAAATGATPADLLSEADTDLTDANTVLSGIDLTGQPSDISSIVTSEMGIIGSQVQIQDELGMFQTQIVDEQMQQLSGMPGYDLVTQATNYLLTQADQGLLNADDALLASDQALVSSISDGSGLTDADTLGGAVAMLEVIGADFIAFGDTFDAAFTPILAVF